MKAFETAMINAEVAKQNRAAQKAAKKAYINDLVKAGVDRELAKIMADAMFEYGIVKAM